MEQLHVVEAFNVVQLGLKDAMCKMMTEAQGDY